MAYYADAANRAAMSPQVYDQLARLEAENGRLFGGIQKFLDMGAPRLDGTEPNKCAHGVWDWDECAGCNNTYFEALLARDPA